MAVSLVLRSFWGETFLVEGDAGDSGSRAAGNPSSRRQRPTGLASFLAPLHSDAHALLVRHRRIARPPLAAPSTPACGGDGAHARLRVRRGAAPDRGGTRGAGMASAAGAAAVR